MLLPELPRAVLALDQARWDHDVRTPPSADARDVVMTDEAFSELMSEYERDWPRWAQMVRRMYAPCSAGWSPRFRVIDGAALISAEYEAQPVEELYRRIECPVTLAFARDEAGEFGFAPPRARDLNIDHLQRTTNVTVGMVAGEHGFYVDNLEDVTALIADLDQRT